LSGQLILSGIMGIVMFAAMLLLRVPYALPLALFATLGEMVPVIGPIVGFTPALAIAILHSRWQFWSVLIIAIVMQKVENLVIAPRVMSRKVSISRPTAFIALLIGGSLRGLVRALMAIPGPAIPQAAVEGAFGLRR